MQQPSQQTSGTEVTGPINELGAQIPTQGGSVYVDPEELDWTPSQFDGIEMKILYQDVGKGEMTVLLRWQPGTTLPFHKHPEIEQSYVIQGSFYDHDGVCHAGQFVWRKPLSKHVTKTDEGCILLAIYRKPNIFAKSAGFNAARAAAKR